MEKRWEHINKYIGKYRVFAPLILDTGKSTPNLDDTYLKGKAGTEVYVHEGSTLAIYFPKGKSTANTVLPKFDELGIEYELYIDGELESIYLINEKDLHKAHSILKFQTKGAKIKPSSVKTARKQIK